MVANRLLGVLVVESEELGAFTAVDEYLLTVVAHIIASAIELDRVAGGTGPGPAPASPKCTPRGGPGLWDAPGLSATFPPMAAPSLTASI